MYIHVTVTTRQDSGLFETVKPTEIALRSVAVLIPSHKCKVTVHFINSMSYILHFRNKIKISIKLLKSDQYYIYF